MGLPVVILAAGKGKRLAPRTLECPKCLIEVCHEPILHYTLCNLPKEADEIILVIMPDPLGELIRDRFGDEYQGHPVQYAIQEERKGTWDAVRRAKDLIRDRTFMVLMGDDIYGPEGLRELVRYGVAVLGDRVERPERYAVITRDAQGRVVRIEEKPKEPETDLVSTGAYVLPPHSLALPVGLSPRGEIELPSLVQALVARGTAMQVVEADYWFPTNTPAELDATEKKLRAWLQ